MRFYGNIKFPIILSINCNLPRKKERKKRLNSSREGRRVYDIRTREKRKTGKVKRRDERDGEEKEEEEEEEEGRGGMRDRNFYPREIEYGSGLWVYTAGGFTGVRQVFFYIPTLFLSFSSLLQPPPPPPLLPNLGMGAHAVCAEFESPCNKIRALCDGRVTPRIYLRKGEMYTGRGIPIYREPCPLIRYKASVTARADHGRCK